MGWIPGTGSLAALSRDGRKILSSEQNETQGSGMVKCDVNRQWRGHGWIAAQIPTQEGWKILANYFVNIHKTNLTPKTRSLHTTKFEFSFVRWRGRKGLDDMRPCQVPVSGPRTPDTLTPLTPGPGLYPGSCSATSEHQDPCPQCGPLTAHCRPGPGQRFIPVSDLWLRLRSQSTWRSRHVITHPWPATSNHQPDNNNQEEN